MFCFVTLFELKAEAEIKTILFVTGLKPWCKIDDNYFDMVVLKILPEAGKMDSSYWQNNQKIPNSLEEIEAYKLACEEPTTRTVAAEQFCSWSA